MIDATAPQPKRLMAPALAAAMGLLALFLPALAVGQQQLDAASAVALGAKGARAADPSVDTHEGAIAIAWTARAGNRTALFAAHANPGAGWGDPVEVSIDSRGEVSDPVVRYDLDGTAVVVWVETDDLRSRLVTQRLGEGRREVIAISDVLMAAPSLAFDDANQPVVAWFEGGANRYAVLAATPDAGIGWVTEPLTSDLNAYDILPVVLGGEQPTVYWYSLTDGDEGTEIRAARRAPDSLIWTTIDTSLLGLLPANRLPYLYDTHTDLGPGAIWVETVTGGEFVVTADPRRPLELYIQPVPNGEGLRQLDPDATGSHGPAAAYAWREEGPDGREIIVLTEDDLYRITGDEHAAQPRLASDATGALHLVYTSDQLSGGSGQVYWLAIERGVVPLRPVASSVFDYEPGDPVF